MTTKTIHQMDRTRQCIHRYFEQGREDAIRHYLSAYTRYRRNEQRSWALHYGRLMRKLGAGV